MVFFISIQNMRSQFVVCKMTDYIIMSLFCITLHGVLSRERACDALSGDPSFGLGFVVLSCFRRVSDA
jgi:hypothetical protein